MVEQSDRFSTLITRQFQSLLGQKCMRISRIIHVMNGVRGCDLGAVQIGWESDDVTLVDTNSDWTVSMSEIAWVDPYEGSSLEEREKSELEIGKWECVDVTDHSPFSRLVGERLISLRGLVNDVDEMTGVDFVFERGVLRCLMWAGEIKALLVT